ncbi:MULTISPECIES: P1 family peptidase [unclassified Pseudomonas]|uniref:P1 family peptidase n=1 Tax=unclassified Pseudomonas TaxID=196821 RepID=UPI0021CC99CB|nr:MULTISPECIES: P1 family peptidase [unclassified Pseudomonas]
MGAAINRTTIIEPRPVAAHLAPCFAGVHVLNGNGDATGLEWICEAGLLTTPIAYTNTHSVGVVRDALVAAERETGKQHTYWCMPVVLETYDGILSDIWDQHVTCQACACSIGGCTQRAGAGRLHGRWQRHDLP